MENLHARDSLGGLRLMASESKTTTTTTIKKTSCKRAPERMRARKSWAHPIAAIKTGNAKEPFAETSLMDKPHQNRNQKTLAKGRRRSFYQVNRAKFCKSLNSSRELKYSSLHSPLRMASSRIQNLKQTKWRHYEPLAARRTPCRIK
jgi:hypothetical protein